MAKTNNKESNNTGGKSFQEATKAFHELKKNVPGQFKTAIIDMVVAAKAEGDNQNECYKRVFEEVKGSVDKSYVSKLTKEQYMTKEELIAEAERLSEQEKLKESVKTPQIVVGADGQTQVVYEEDNDEIGKLSPGAQRDLLKSKNDLQSKKVSAGSGQISRTKPSVQAGELDDEEDEEEDSNSGNVVGTGLNAKIVINNSKIIDEIKSIINTGKGIIIFVDSNSQVENVMPGDLLH